jgi:A/G-specific adenine glycosylase
LPLKISIKRHTLVNDFNHILTEWYEENQRDLPWRHTKNPYLIWISEIILQQTRVAQGYDYYVRFIERFPDVATLAAADEDEVLRYWQGLGYYSRARNLHKAAKSIGNQPFPTTYKEVLSLSGVGPYTAAAISSIAYQEPVAVVDGNVYRVLSRFFGIDTPIDSTAGTKMFAELAQSQLDITNPGKYNQAIMDFGAMQCVPLHPDCSACPLASRCAALAEGKVTELPVKAHRTQVADRYFNYINVRTRDSLLLHKRTADDIWKGLYELPLIETDGEIDVHTLCSSPAFRSLTEKWTSPVLTPLFSLRQVLTHRIIHGSFYRLDIDTFEGTQLPEGMIVVTDDECDSYAMPRLIRRFFEKCR